ncbi:MAG TPA: hypothetical protein VJQ54_20710 [Candidatus Sulfotelmatobacter sp.]|nr:hypothetical protein [Candidatus Sulfotelmatobacter sp.]
MLNINEQEAFREEFARSSFLRRFDDFWDGYNTGVSIVASNASEYISYCLIKGAADRVCSAQPSHDLGGRFIATGGAMFLVYEFRAEAETCATVFATPAQMLETIRSAFMLKVSAAAAVLRVTRPTIYQWSTLNDVAQIRAREDRERLQTVFRLARSWNDAGSLMGRWLERTLPSGRTVLDLLSDVHIDETAMMAAHSTLKAAAPQLRKAEHDRALGASKVLSSAFEKLAANEQKRRKEKT